QIIGAIITLIIGLWLAKFISKLVAKTLIKKEVDQTLTKFFASLVKSALIIFVLISVASQLGIETTSFIAIIGAAGLAIGFALQGSLSNFAAGIMLIIFRPVKAGDFIEGGGIMGSVEQVGIFVTILNTPDNKKIFVPNSKLTSDNIINFSANDTRRVDMVFGIGYSDDIDNAKSTIKSVLENDNRVLKEPVPQIVVSELADSSVNFNVRPWVNNSDYWGVYFDITEKVKKKFDEQKISIPFPQRDVHIHQN
ncbi:MAG TPA: mechanosensitive ion channel domain-containing protein, partial [Ignavibacteriaceae bacterium]|nr:mechanosensitive ion channel domain-containing protein [Ignavibacteriaceae bacterium]